MCHRRRAIAHPKLGPPLATTHLVVDVQNQVLRTDAVALCGPPRGPPGIGPCPLCVCVRTTQIANTLEPSHTTSKRESAPGRASNDEANLGKAEPAGAKPSQANKGLTGLASLACVKRKLGLNDTGSTPTMSFRAALGRHRSTPKMAGACVGRLGPTQACPKSHADHGQPWPAKANLESARVTPCRLRSDHCRTLPERKYRRCLRLLKALAMQVKPRTHRSSLSN